MENHDLITEQFTKQAKTFDRIPGHYDGLDLILSMAQPQAHDEVLDVASGTGIVAAAFAPYVKSVRGIDLVPAMISQAQAMQKRKGFTNMRWDNGNINPLPYPKGNFSIAVTRFSFHHLIAPLAVLKEMVRVTKAGGKVMIIDVFVTDEQQARFYNQMETLRDPSHVRALFLSELAGLMKKAGLTDVQTDFFRLEVDLENQLKASFPQPGHEARIRQMIMEDIGKNKIGLQAQIKNGRVVFSYPIVVMLAQKA